MCLTRVIRENFTGFPREIHMLLLVGYILMISWPNGNIQLILDIVRPS